MLRQRRIEKSVRLALMLACNAALCGAAAGKSAGAAGTASIPASVAEPFKAGAAPVAGQVFGQGDGQIHVIPALSAPSVKNGGKLTIQAVVKAVAGVARVVEAEIEGVAKVPLRPGPAKRLSQNDA